MAKRSMTAGLAGTSSSLGIVQPQRDGRQPQLAIRSLWLTLQGPGRSWIEGRRPKRRQRPVF